MSTEILILHLRKPTMKCINTIVL